MNDTDYYEKKINSYSGQRGKAKLEKGKGDVQESTRKKSERDKLLMVAESIISRTEPRSMRMKREVEDHNPSAKTLC